jgi:hypothetical protein
VAYALATKPALVASNALCSFFTGVPTHILRDDPKTIVVERSALAIDLISSTLGVSVIAKVPAYANSGAMSSTNGTWVVGKDINYVSVCTGPPLNTPSYQAIPTSYPHNPQTPPEGITATSDGTAYLLDNNTNAVVQIPRPSYYCPFTADAVRSRTSVVKQHAISIVRESMLPASKRLHRKM